MGWASDTATIEVPENICAGGCDAVYKHMATLHYQPIHFLISPDSQTLIEAIQKLYKV